jgi:hypothetical protein
MTRKWPGPALIRNVSIEGFETGVATAQTEYGLTFDHIRLTGQRGAAFRNDQNALSIRDLEVQGPAPAVVNSGAKGFIAIDGGKITAASSTNSGMILTRNVEGAPPDWKTAARSAWTPKPFEIAQPPELAPARWANTAKYGAAPDSPAVATEGLHRAFASGEATVYLPHGTYLIDDTIEIPATVRRIVGMNSTIRVAPSRRPSFSRTAGMLRIASAGESLSIENLAFDNTNQGAQLAVEVSGERDVILRDIVSAGVVLLDRAKDGGRVRLENVCCGRMEIAGPRPVEAVQFDTEGGGTRIANRGSPLSILGLKTEGISTIVDNRDGARTDIFGGLVYMVRDPKGEPPPAFQSSGSHLSAAFAEEVLKPGNQYRVYLSHEGGNVEAKDFPERGPGRFATSLSADPATPPTQ